MKRKLLILKRMAVLAIRPVLNHIDRYWDIYIQLVVLALVMIGGYSQRGYFAFGAEFAIIIGIACYMAIRCDGGRRRQHRARAGCHEEVKKAA